MFSIFENNTLRLLFTFTQKGVRNCNCVYGALKRK